MKFFVFSGSLWHSYEPYFFCYSFLFKLMVYALLKINTTTTTSLVHRPLDSTSLKHGCVMRVDRLNASNVGVTQASAAIAITIATWPIGRHLPVPPVLVDNCLGWL